MLGAFEHLRNRFEASDDRRIKTMGCSDGEAMSAPQLGPAGGYSACHGGDAGSASIPPRRGIRRRGLSFETTCLIGQGSAALVYLVRCKRTGTMSALKVRSCKMELPARKIGQLYLIGQTRTKHRSLSCTCAVVVVLEILDFALRSRWCTPRMP